MTGVRGPSGVELGPPPWTFWWATAVIVWDLITKPWPAWLIAAAICMPLVAFQWTVRDWRRAGLPLPWEDPSGRKR